MIPEPEASTEDPEDPAAVLISVASLLHNVRYGNVAIGPFAGTRVGGKAHLDVKHAFLSLCKYICTRRTSSDYISHDVYIT